MLLCAELWRPFLYFKDSLLAFACLNLIVHKGFLLVISLWLVIVLVVMVSSCIIPPPLISQSNMNDVLHPSILN